MFDRRLAAASWVAIAALLAPATARSAPFFHHPHDVVVDVVLAPGYPQDPRMFVASPGTMNLFLVSTDHGLTWEHSRTGLAGKMFSRLELSSDWETSGVAFVATEDRGIQVSTDHCKTWNPATFDVPFLSQLEAAPVAPDGGRTLFTSTRRTAFRSDDGAAHFEKLSLSLASGEIESLAVSPNYLEDRTVMLGLSDGRVLVSRNGGAKWEVHELPGKVPVKSVAFSPKYAQDRQCWAATWTLGMFHSKDGGVTFEACNQGLTDKNVNSIDTASSPEGVEVFVCTKDDGVFHSKDAGTTWKLTGLRVNKTVQTKDHHTRVVVSPSWPEDRTVLCCAYEGLNVSRDGGDTWRESNIDVTRIGRHIQVSPNFAEDGVLIGAGYGMHMMLSEDRGTTWVTRGTGIRADSVYSMALSPNFAKDGLILLGMWHGVRRSTDRGLTWESVEVPPDPDEVRTEVGYTMRSITFSPKFAEDQIVFSVSSWGVLYRSDDAGKSWRMVRRVSNLGDAFQFSPEYPEEKTMFIGGAKGIWRSDDDGETLKHVLEGALPNDGLLVPPDFAQTGELYCIERLGGFMIGSDRGETWSPSNDGLEGFAPAVIRLSPDFVHDHSIFLLASGAGMFRSSDRGRSWKRITPPGSPIDQGISMVVSSDFPHDQTALVGTYDGFCRSRDGGVTWELVTSEEQYDDKRDPWMRAGTGWTFLYSPQFFTQSISVSENPGDTITIPFCGKVCKLMGTKGPKFGIADILLDGEKVAAVDCFARRQLPQQVLFEREVDDGYHVLTMRVTGEKNEKATGSLVGVDFLNVRYR